VHNNQQTHSSCYPFKRNYSYSAGNNHYLHKWVPRKPEITKLAET